ncbi:hypothetical protein ACP275_10G133600 [Erythranthe tilingii]
MKYILSLWLMIALILLSTQLFSFPTRAYGITSKTSNEIRSSSSNLERGKSSTHLAIEHTSKSVKLSREIIVVQIKRRVRSSSGNTTSSSPSSIVREKSSLLVQACFGINFSIFFAFFFL